MRVDDEELFPADLLCLYSALPDHACFIKTTNLDGESNLKIRRPVDLREAAPEEESDVMHIKAALECEPPNANLHKFQGRLVYKAGTEGARLLGSYSTGFEDVLYTCDVWEVCVPVLLRKNAM